MAEERIRVGKEQEGGKEKVKKWKDHAILFRHQFEEAKDKEIHRGEEREEREGRKRKEIGESETRGGKK